MIRTEGHHNQVRQVAVLDVGLKLSQKDIQPVLIWNPSVEIGEVRIKVLLNRWYIRNRLEPAQWNMQRARLFSFQNESIVVPGTPAPELLTRPVEVWSELAIDADAQAVG